MTNKISLEWNKYKADGKCWLAKVTESGLQFQKYDQIHEQGTKSGGVYQGTRVFNVKEDGQYIANEQNSKSSNLRHRFTIQKGKIQDIQTTHILNGRKSEHRPALSFEEIQEQEQELER